MEENQFAGLIREWWDRFNVEGRVGFRHSMKLRKLKEKIKERVRDVLAVKTNILEEVQPLDLKEESGILSVEEVDRRIALKD